MSIVVYSTSYRPVLIAGRVYNVPVSLPAWLSPSRQRIYSTPPRIAYVEPPRASLLRYFVLDPTIRFVGPYAVEYDGSDYFVHLTPQQADRFLNNWWISLNRWTNIPYAQRKRIWQLSGRRIVPDNESTVTTPLVDKTATIASPFTYTFASNTFTNPDNGTPFYSYKARLANGAYLPSWLTFNPLTRTFFGTPPTGSAGTYSIKVTATDEYGRQVSDTYNLVVS